MTKKKYPEIDTRFYYQSPSYPEVLLLGAVADSYKEGRKFGQWLNNNAAFAFTMGLLKELDEEGWLWKQHSEVER